MEKVKNKKKTNQINKCENDDDEMLQMPLTLLFIVRCTHVHSFLRFIHVEIVTRMIFFCLQSNECKATEMEREKKNA